ncbi:MAG: glutaredoxin family protein [Nitrospinota bacterium]|jgi:glutaredoxin|nr:glutaredoxin family protein [Nitrospinota bacterium]MDH5789902.1 glutaredoxin family protein [Nitrospinota bacterium]
MITIEVMTKKDCCLCDDAKEIIEQVIGEFPAEMRMTDIESDSELFERYKEKIPVVLINGEESFVYKVHPVTLRKKLEKILENN